MSTPVTLDEDGAAVGGVAVSPETVAVLPQKRKVQPHEIARGEGSLVPYMGLDQIANKLFLRQMEFAVYASYALNETVAREYLEIVKVEVCAYVHACAPVV